MGVPKNREAGDKGPKGSRLQKIRAAIFLLESLESDDKAKIFYLYLEHQGDITSIDVNSAGKKEYVEEDKNYNPQTSFTINSPEILNTLNIFLDIWIDKQYSESCAFGFYSTNSIGKENITKNTKDLIATIESEAAIKGDSRNPVIEILQEHTYSVSFINEIKKIILNNYKIEYAKEPNCGNYNIISGFTDDEWRSFFGIINWGFESDNHEDLEKILIEKIKTSRMFNGKHEGKETFISAAIMDLLDKKQMIPDLAEKMMHNAEIEVIFLKIGSNEVTHEGDPVWEMWQEIDEPNDKRNLREKIIAVYSDFSEKRLGLLAQKACRSKMEAENSKNKKDFLSIKYRVYEKCLDLFIDFCSQPINEEAILFFIKELKSKINNELTELKGIYGYNYLGDDFIEGMILDLIDSCYLNFDND